MKASAIICDLDGTLYNAKNRQERYLLSGKKDFDGFHKAAEDDNAHTWCLELIQAMRLKGFSVIFTSGRDVTYRHQTEVWIKKHLNWGPGNYELHMRPAGDYSADDTMKKCWYESDLSYRYTILFAVDDRKRVVDMWRSLGIPCLQCDEGNF